MAGDGGRTVGLGAHRATGNRALQDLVRDGGWVFAAGVVAGHHHLVGLLLGHGAHQRALAWRRGRRRSRTRTTAARHAQQPGAQGLQGLVQSIGVWA